MLNRLGSFVAKNRWWIIAAWVIATAIIIVFSPRLSSVTSSDQTSFLPNKYQSVQAQKIADTAFPGTKNDVEILLVQRQDHNKLTPNDKRAISKLASSLEAAKIDRIGAVMTSPQMIAQDGTAQMVQLVVTGRATGGNEDVDTVRAIRSKVRQQLLGSNLQAGLTGNLAMNADTTTSFSSAEKIVTAATFALVIILPAIIFRSPVAAFAPVLAVSLVYALAQSIIALAAKTFSFKISDQLSILYTVVLFGIGTDYILFLLFRYRERLRTGARGREVVAFALSRAGEAILSAALVVAAAFAALGVSDFGMFKNLAPGLVICVITMLLAVLTLIPAVVAIIGPKIFWPSKNWLKQPETKLSQKLGGLVARRPLVVLGLSLVVLLIFASGYPHFKTNYDFTSQQPQNTESAKTYNEVTRLFSAGAVAPTSVLLVSNTSLTKAQLNSFTHKVLAIKGATPGGKSILSQDSKTGKITVLLQGDATATSTLDYVSKTFVPAVRAAAPKGTQAYVYGESASFADVRSAVNRDLSVILPTAAIIIFVILALLLRSALAPLYLLMATALGFMATLGGTAYLFQDILGNRGLIFFIPIMVYIFVVAVGTDYNILTMTRLREEVRAGVKPLRAADMTIEHSSTTVASAGLILAGTFGSLALAGLSLLSQLGFAVAFGIVLAAFVIAPLLVPSVAALLGYKVWWPGHRPAPDKNRD